MHAVGVKTLAALRDRWPDLVLRAAENAHGSMLTVWWTTPEGRQFAVSSPPTIDYRQHPYLWWLHRCSTQIKETLA